jgi:hypothetical protein
MQRAAELCADFHVDSLRQTRIGDVFKKDGGDLFLPNPANDPGDCLRRGGLRRSICRGRFEAQPVGRGDHASVGLPPVKVEHAWRASAPGFFDLVKLRLPSG